MRGANFHFSQKIGLKSTKNMRFCILHKPMGGSSPAPPPWLRYCTVLPLPSNTKQKATKTFFLMCASCFFVNHFLFYFFLFLLAVWTAKPHFATLLQPGAPGAEPEPPSGCYATVFRLALKCKKNFKIQILENDRSSFANT